MPTLSQNLHSLLVRTIHEARNTAQSAARLSLEKLQVAQASAPGYLSPAEVSLHQELRARSMALGDEQDLASGELRLHRLVEEVAYEHWHRMLFLRFLAQNQLLMYPDPVQPVPITLAECRELAGSGEGTSMWEVAAKYASFMLPQIFATQHPALSLALAPEYQQKLESLLAKLPDEVFTATDSLGWVYQYWQAPNKLRISSAQVKIGASEISAVTQLFTEPYMVSFLLDNTLGAWWLRQLLSEPQRSRLPLLSALLVGCEERLEADSVSSLYEYLEKQTGVRLEYLRLLPDPKACWGLRPAAGWMDNWPDSLRNFRLLDPCCGSGHFLVAAFRLLVPMRMYLEGVSAAEAVDAVLRDNIYGLELDRRCVEIAAFALALAAWQYPGAGGYRALPAFRLACCGQALMSRAQPECQQAQPAVQLAWQLEHADTIGSLIQLTREDYLRLLKEQTEASCPTGAAALPDSSNYVQAYGRERAWELLTLSYHLVVTNVPYLARGKQSEVLRQFCAQNYPDSKNELATVFLERLLKFCEPRGTTAVVLPQNWLFLVRYSSLRQKLLQNNRWNLLVRLGEGGFKSPAAAGAFVALLVMSHQHAEVPLVEERQSSMLAGLDTSAWRLLSEKQQRLKSEPIVLLPQDEQLANPDARVSFVPLGLRTQLSDYAYGYVGLQTGDDPCYVRYFWEFAHREPQTWEFLQTTPCVLPAEGAFNADRMYAGQSMLVRWEGGRSALHRVKSAHVTNGLKALGKPGIALHRLRQLVPYVYSRERFHQNIAAIIPKDPKHWLAIWCFCTSPEYKSAVRQLDQKLNVTNATLIKVPFDLPYWQRVAQQRYPHGLPLPFTNASTMWIFHGHPCGTLRFDAEQQQVLPGFVRCDDEVLQIAVARLLGYVWPAFEEQKLELAAGMRELVELSLQLTQGSEKDNPCTCWSKDGIACLSALLGRPDFASALHVILEKSFAQILDWSPQPLGPQLQRLKQQQKALFSTWLNAVLASAGCAGKSLDYWLREKFFSQHCRLWQNRPFIWHIWDGLADGFSVLVNYHRLNRRTLELLINVYLGEWIRLRREDCVHRLPRSKVQLQAALGLQRRLQDILAGETPWDIFVRWKSIEEQPVGWNPDLNDGVRVNIRPFMTKEPGGSKSTSLLRSRPRISWNKDRGRNEAMMCHFPNALGERCNDWHLSLQEKHTTRSKANSDCPSQINKRKSGSN